MGAFLQEVADFHELPPKRPEFFAGIVKGLAERSIDAPVELDGATKEILQDDRKDLQGGQLLFLEKVFAYATKKFSPKAAPEPASASATNVDALSQLLATAGIGRAAETPQPSLPSVKIADAMKEVDLSAAEHVAWFVCLAVSFVKLTSLFALSYLLLRFATFWRFAQAVAEIRGLARRSDEESTREVSVRGPGKMGGASVV